MDKVQRLAAALREAEIAHAQYELRDGKEEWPEFYAQYLIDAGYVWLAPGYG